MRSPQPTRGLGGNPGQAYKALWAFFGALLVLRFIAIYRENINWDEWALFARVADTLRTGVLDGGGRPGLATLVLIPFVRDCVDAVASVRAARWLWTGIVVAYAWGFWLLIRRVLEPSEHARKAAALALGMVVLVPAFLRWSIQVRADQPALAFAIWGGVALLASERRVGWAFVAGALSGVGFLFSQKAAYVAALVGALAAGRLMLRGDFRWSRDFARAALCVAGGVLVLVAFDRAVTAITSTSSVPDISGQVQGGLGTFEYYRRTLGYRLYIEMLPTLAPHLITGALVIGAAFMPTRVTQRREIKLALLILLLCVALVGFHAARFEYFWMTLGLFPAAAAAVSIAATQQLFGERMRPLFVPALWALLLAASVPLAFSMLADTQRVQRESLAFINGNFGPDDLGFHPERALFCRRDPNPLPTYFSQHIFWEFYGSDSIARTEALIGELKERPISFVVETYRLDQFPEPVRHFLRSAYVPYRAGVMIPGFSFNTRSGARRELHPVVPGTYRFLSNGQGSGEVEIEGRTLLHGDTLTLEPRAYEARWSGSESGFLVLAVSDPPAVSSQAFYAPVRPQSVLFGSVPHPERGP